MTSSTPTPLDTWRPVLAEFVGTMFLLISVVGSGTMAQNLTDDVGLQLLMNAIATGGALIALILAFIAVSGAHFNPAVTLADWALGGTDRATATRFIPAQILGAGLGVIVANIMFDTGIIEWSTKDRTGFRFIFSEGIATIGLLLIIFGVSRAQGQRSTAVAVGAWITGAYAFTSSTSFANPAVTLARTMSDTFAGIDPPAVPGFLVAQAVGTVIAIGLARVLFPEP